MPASAAVPPGRVTSTSAFCTTCKLLGLRSNVYNGCVAISRTTSLSLSRIFFTKCGRNAVPLPARTAVAKPTVAA